MPPDPTVPSELPASGPSVVLGRGRFVVAGAAGAGAVLGLAASFALPPVFEVTATLAVARVGARPVDPSAPELEPAETPSVLAVWLSQDATLQQVPGLDTSGLSAQAWVEPSGLVGLRVTGPDEARAVDAATGLGRLAQERHAPLVVSYIEGLEGLERALGEALATATEEAKAGLAREKLGLAMHLGRARAAETTLLAPPSVAKVASGRRRFAIAGAAAGFLLAWAWLVRRGVVDGGGAA